MTTTTSAWESLTGRRDVLIGASLSRAWNERIGKTAKRSKGYPNPEYYSLRYNFKPESIDDENVGTLTPKPGGDGQARFYELERPSQQGDSHHFTAEQQPSKEWECVLLWDPVLQQLTLEKLESTLNLTHEGRSSTKGRPPSSTPPSLSESSRGKRGAGSTPASRSAQDSPMVSARELAEDLERALTGSADVDAEGEPDEELEFRAALDAAAENIKQEEEEEDEEEMEAVDVAAPPPPPIKARAPPKAKPNGKARPRSGSKRDRDDDIEEELLAFGEPSRATKRKRGASTNGASNSGLALPTAPPQNHTMVPTPSELLQPPSRITYAGSESSDDSDDGGQELGEELDAAALELELEQTLAEEAEEAEDDEEMEAGLLGNGRHDTRRPLSLNELLGGQSQNDEDSTSDDSDDD